MHLCHWPVVNDIWSAHPRVPKEKWFYAGVGLWGRVPIVWSAHPRVPNGLWFYTGVRLWGQRSRFTWRDHSVGITRGGITQSELHVAGSLSRNISLKVPNPTKVSVHMAGSLNQNYTWRDHSDGITRGGITQSEYFPKGPQSHRGLGSRGGITQLELHVAGSLSLNISLKVPNPTEVSVPKDSPVPNPTDVSIHVAESLCPQLLKLILVPTSVNGQGWSVVPSQCARSATIVFKMLFHQFICKCHFCCFILNSLFWTNTYTWIALSFNLITNIMQKNISDEYTVPQCIPSHPIWKWFLWPWALVIF